ncbi:MAG TPA: FAD-dependent oxidoreductase [Pyrinomonadaceae bacterium]|nr:FAD-dependent oxidoreductase [Pyrinomonadaceae bacterium]
MGKEQLLVIGGVAAGLAAAMQARRAAPSLGITVLEKTADISYGACGLPYVISGIIPALERLVVHTPEYFQEQHNIKVQLHTEALEILPARSLVRVSVNGERREMGFDNLVLATGAAAVCPPLPGHDLSGVFVLRQLRDGRRLLQFIERERPRAAVIVGAGYIGLEMAEAFRARGLETTLVESSDRMMSTLGGRLRDRVVDELREGGVEVVLGERVSAFEGRGEGVARVICESGRAFEAQVVLIGVGVRPAVEIAKGAGLEIGESGAIVADANQRTSAANIFAAGDCTETLHRVSGRRVWMPLAQPAVRQGWVAGANAAGARPEARYAGVTGTNAVKVFGLEVARTGLSLEEARSAGFDASTIEDESSTRAGYYPGGDKILTRIIHDKSGRLLGAQMVGREGVAGRIDVYAAALHANLKIEDVNQLDLAYAPPFAPTIDPILRATRPNEKG